MKYIFWTKNGSVDEYRLASYVEVVKEKEGSDTVEVRFLSDNTTMTVKRSELFDPDMVPFKVGDVVQNINSFMTSEGSRGWPGINWVVKKVTYSTPSFNSALLVCYSREVCMANKIFLSHEVKKV